MNMECDNFSKEVGENLIRQAIQIELAWKDLEEIADGTRKKELFEKSFLGRLKKVKDFIW